MKSIDEFVNQIICGDCLEVLSRVPDNSIDMCMTSPSYWGLRDYGVEQIFGGNKNCEHEWGETFIRMKSGGKGYLQDANKGSWSKNEQSVCKLCGAWKGQLGLEPTPELYIEHMTEIFHEVKRVLKKEGTFWLNVGDTYFGSGCGTNDYRTPASISLSKPELYNSPRPQNIKQHRYLKSKSLCMIPERLAWSLIQDGWILRNKIAWYKPNSMPSSAKDRFSNTWEYIFLFSKGKKYYFDLDAVRESHKEDSIKRACRAAHRDDKPYAVQGERDYIGYENIESNFKNSKLRDVNALGKNPGDHWSISTKSFPEAHFAVFPEKLCEKPIKAGCPEEVCKKCGKAKERIIKQERKNTRPGRNVGQGKSGKDADPNESLHGSDLTKYRQSISYKTIGWASCNCNAGFEGGIVLDPFCGAGTALYVAKEMRRRYIGIDIKQKYIDMSKKRSAQGVL